MNLTIWTYLWSSCWYTLYIKLDRGSFGPPLFRRRILQSSRKYPPISWFQNRSPPLFVSIFLWFQVANSILWTIAKCCVISVSEPSSVFVASVLSAVFSFVCVLCCVFRKDFLWCGYGGEFRKYEFFLWWN